jgi:arylsulfatase A-like enzyme
LDNPAFSAHQKLPDDADPDDPASYIEYEGNDYAPDHYHAAALQFIRDHRDAPFFLYLPTTVPHLALQVPADSLAEYEGVWPDPPYPGGHGYLPHLTPRAAYAAMVTRMDQEVGRIFALLNELDLQQRTLVVFTSDNGPTYDRLGGSDSDFFQSAGPFRGLKGSLYEGGVRVPLIVWWPGRIAAGAVSDRITGFEDWMPTLLELAGAKTAIPAGLDGISFAPTLLGRSQPDRPFLYREFPGYGGQQFVRVGNWKGMRQNLIPRDKQQQPDLHVALYDLVRDPGETTDVAKEHPEIVERMLALMREQHTPSADFRFPALDTTTPPKP